MAPKRKLDDEDGDVSAGSAGEEKQDGVATEADTPVKKGRGRPRKADSDKKPYTPTGNPRGRPRTKIPGADMRKKRGRPSLSSKFGTDSSDGEDSPPASRKKRGRPRLAPKSGTDKDVNIVSTNQPRKRGRPLGSSKQQKGDKAIQVKKKYFKKEKYRLQVKPFKLRRAKFKPKPSQNKFMTVKPITTEPTLPKFRSVPITVQLAQSHKDEKSSSPQVNLRTAGTSHLNLRNSGTSTVTPTIFNVTPSRGSNVRYPMLNEYQRSLLHVNHSKHLLNYECDREPALDVLQKKLLAVNTQLIDTKEQRLELDKRIIIFKQRKIELERQLLNYRPQRRVLTRVEQIPVIDVANDQQSGVQHGAKIQGWVSVADNHVKVPNCSPSLKNCEHNTKIQTSGPLHSRARSSADDLKEVKKPKKVTSRSEKRGRGRPRKQE